MDPRRIQSQFFSQQNESMILGLVTQDFQKRTGGSLNEREAARLERTVEHYMDEVWEGNGPIPVQDLNREVITATISDFTSYIRRGTEQVPQQVAVQRVVSMPQRPIFNESIAGPQQLLMDTGDRFEQLQQQRNQMTGKPPKVPDFRIELEDDKNAPSALEQFELAKRQREEQILAAMPKQPSSLSQIKEVVTLPPTSLTPDPNGNATIALAGTTDDRPRLQQDILIKQDPIVNYKEIEENLFVFSADRDWVNNTTQNRYNFTINFDVANNRQGFGIGAAVTKKFKNIVRIELVKAILPAEGLETLMQNVDPSGGFTPSTNVSINALSFPYVILRVPELDGNNYGSDNHLDNAFGVVQYDANWNTDNTNLNDARGYFAMIPKFMKCQRVYTPTPLATLTKLSFQIQRPSGAYLSDVSDSLRILAIRSAIDSGYTGTTKYSSASLVDANGAPLYWIVQTQEAFSRFAFTVGDRVMFGGIDVTGIPTTGFAKDDMKSWFENPEGHLIVGIGYTDGTNITDDLNAAGYANYLVIQSPWKNVNAVSQVGSSTPYTPNVQPFGGSVSAMNTLGDDLKSVIFTAGRVLNYSHQTQLVFRVITREMDPTMRVRPDNL
jgi:hypothetical protein